MLYISFCHLTRRQLYWHRGEQIHITRGRKILEAAAADKNEVLILGAFGCGAFMNKPEVVAGAYKKLMGEFQNAFEMYPSILGS